MVKPHAGSGQIVWTLLVAGGFVLLVLMQRPSQSSLSGAVASVPDASRAPASIPPSELTGRRPQPLVEPVN